MQWREAEKFNVGEFTMMEEGGPKCGRRVPGEFWSTIFANKFLGQNYFWRRIFILNCAITAQ